jgi:uncharacterized protein
VNEKFFSGARPLSFAPSSQSAKIWGLAPALLELLDWKRRIFALYAEVRGADPRAGWERWRAVRAELFRTHPQSPKPGYDALDYFPYDPAFRFLGEVEPAEEELREIDGFPFRRFARVRFPLGSLELYWLEGYGGGVFLPFADATRGRESYGAGRYLLDTVKGSDLGMEDGRLVLDFNFAYNPSCAYDDSWACPLAPPANRLEVEVRAGERMLAA